MRYYIIYFLNLQTQKPSFYKYYDDEKKAQSMLESVALDYVKKEQGKQQSDIAIQPTKSISEIQFDNTLKEGLYLKVEGSFVSVYEKIKVSSPGFLYSSYEIKMNKIGKFDVTHIDLDIPDNCTISPNVKQNINDKSYTYIDELKERLSQINNKFGLKNVVV